MLESCRDSVPVKHLVVDSAGFLKNAKLQLIGSELYTLPDVVSEIRDAATRQRLQVLPYELILCQDIDKQSLKTVTEFSKKTGDLPSLSATDLRVLALTHMLEVRHNGHTHLSTLPTVVHTVSHVHTPQHSNHMVGFHIPSIGQMSTEGTATVDTTEELTKSPPDNNQDEAAVEELKGDIEDISLEEDGNTSDSDEREWTSSGEDDWITEDNVQEALSQADADTTALVDSSLQVACLTTDFAMQNVLLHMGLRVVSLDGMLIRRLKSYILRCRACFQTTSVMTKRFCGRCGNECMSRVAVTVEPDGTTILHLSSRRPPTTRGLKHTLPPPKGGKHGRDVQVVEDQRLPHNRLSRKGNGPDVFDTDFVTRESPFALNDVTSRAALLGVRGMHKGQPRNPNATGKGKKRGGKKR